jgi:hypothetical protein
MTDYKMSFPLTDDLHCKIKNAIDKLRENPSDKSNRQYFIQVANELTAFALDYFFLNPLEIVGAGMISRKAAKLGLTTAKKGISIGIKNVINSLKDDKLLKLVDFIDSLIET